MLRNTTDNWGIIAKSLHWMLAGFIFVQFVLGPLAVSWRLSPTKLDLYVWHKSIGILILALVIVRAIWRLLNLTPALPPDLPRWEHLSARLSHALLYLMMFMLPISGWVINSAANIPFKVFWAFPLPDLVSPDKSLAELAKVVHFSLVIGLIILLVLHIGAAIRHHFIKRNNVLVRMLWSRRSES
ncbi:MAG: cytochrome b [Woeseiaceae bacterium]